MGNADCIKAIKIKSVLEVFSLYYEVILIGLLMDELLNQYWFECHASIFQVKSRMMGDSAYKNTVDCFIKTLKYEVCYINFYIFSFSAFLGFKHHLSPQKKNDFSYCIGATDVYKVLKLIKILDTRHFMSCLTSLRDSWLCPIQIVPFFTDLLACIILYERQLAFFQ